MKRVYIFRGAPASGKGTVVPEFAKLLPGPAALISEDEFRWGFHLIGRNIPDVSDQEHRFAYENMRLLYEQYLKRKSYTIVVEGLFTWDDQNSSQGCVTDLVNLANKYGFEYKSILLTAEKDVLMQRKDLREYVVPNEEFEQLYQNIYSKTDDSEIQIDSTDLSVDQTLEKLKNLLS